MPRPLLNSKFSPWLMALLVAFGLSTCAPAESGDVTTVSFMIWGDPAEQAAFQGVIDGFHAATPGVQVDLIALPNQGDFSARLTSDFAAGTPPDVFLLNYRRMAQFYNKGALEPLGPFLAESETLDAADYYQIALRAFEDSAGNLICFPQNISSQVVYYNKDIFDALGLPYPSDDWTWEEFRQTAIALTLPDTNFDGEPDQHGLGLEPTLIRMASFIWQNGGQLVDDPAQPSQLTLNTPLAVEGMQFVVDLSQVDRVVPNKTAEAIQSHGERFLTGNIAMYVNSRRITPVVREVAEFNWDVAAFPRGAVPASVLHSDGYCLAAESEVKAAAWQFIEFAMSAEGQRLASRLGRTVPSLISVAESEAFLDPTRPPANAAVWLEAAPYLRVLPRVENWPEIERIAAVEFELTYLGQQPLGVAVQNIQQASQRGFVALE